MPSYGAIKFNTTKWGGVIDWEAAALSRVAAAAPPVALGDGLRFVSAKASWITGIVHAAGYDEAKVWYQWSDDEGKTLGTFGSGGTVKEVSASDAQQPAIVPMPDGRVLVLVALNNKVRPMVSADGGETWTVADTIK